MSNFILKLRVFRSCNEHNLPEVEIQIKQPSEFSKGLFGGFNLETCGFVDPISRKNPQRLNSLPWDNRLNSLSAQIKWHLIVLMLQQNLFSVCYYLMGEASSADKSSESLISCWGSRCLREDAFGGLAFFFSGGS